MNRITACLLAFGPLLGCESTEPATTDVIDGQCPMSCDDHEPCTDDRCDAETGECIHVPRDVQEACRQDSHCDDGDPCTTDSCGVDPECSDLQRCHHVQVENCRSCPTFASQCNDGNACTADRCDSDLICRYETFENCNPRCNYWSLSGPGQTSVGPATVRGMPTPEGGAACASGCACEKGIALTDGFSTLRLGMDEPAGCDVTSCAQDFTCAPMEANRYYLVYGEASNPPAPSQVPARADAGGGGAMPEDAAIPFEPASLLAVEGYCLSLDGPGTNGTYDATLVLDDEAQAITYRVDLSEQMPTMSGTTRIQTMNLSMWVDEGVYMHHEFVLDGRSVVAHLFSGPDRLSGPLFDPSQSAEAQPGPDGGAKPDPDEAPGVPEPPPPETGKRIGTLTWVLR